jgi:hypothetical protein
VVDIELGRLVEDQDDGGDGQQQTVTGHGSSGSRGTGDEERGTRKGMGFSRPASLIPRPGFTILLLMRKMQKARYWKTNPGNT